MPLTVFIKNEIALCLLIFLFLIFVIAQIRGKFISLNRVIGIISDEMRSVMNSINSITAGIIHNSFTLMKTKTSSIEKEVVKKKVETDIKAVDNTINDLEEKINEHENN